MHGKVSYRRGGAERHFVVSDFLLLPQGGEGGSRVVMVVGDWADADADAEAGSKFISRDLY